MQRFFKFFYALLIGAILLGCKQAQDNQIADLKAPQDASLYVANDDVLGSDGARMKLKDEYLQKFFAPFGEFLPNPNSQEVFWMQNTLTKYQGFGENLKKNSVEFLEGILDLMQIEAYPNIVQKAIVIKDTNVRVVPSLKPSYSKKEGYPLDRWQNSSIFYGTPVLITQIDKSKRFAHIQTEFIYGWVELRDLAFVSEKQAKELLKIKDFVMSNRDDSWIVFKGQALTQARIGKLFYLVQKDKILGFLRGDDGNLKIAQIRINPLEFHAFPQPFSQALVAEYINVLMGQKYGWGGMYEGRDCSSFIRDIFANFGLYLPRNSAAQAFYDGLAYRFDSLPLAQKEEKILQDATPFATLLWLKGHIMIYIGKNQVGEPMVAHSAWSVQTKSIFGKKEYVLGGVVVTTLKPANEHNGIWIKSPTLGERTRTMTDLSQKLRG